MYQIGKLFRFEAAHCLPLLPDGHKCKRPHGHSYHVWLGLRSAALDEYGFVVDYGELTEFRALIDSLDHRDLNQLFDWHTSAENLARWLFGEACNFYGPLVEYVEVRETETSYARYSR